MMVVGRKMKKILKFLLIVIAFFAVEITTSSPMENDEHFMVKYIVIIKIMFVHVIKLFFNSC